MTPAEFDKQLAEKMAGFYNDSAGFVRFAFPWGQPGTPLQNFIHGPEDWHLAMFEGLAEHVTGNMVRMRSREETLAWWSAVASGHGVGKSACVSWLILWLMSTRIDCRGVVTANTENQLTDKTWPELSKWHNLAVNKHWFKWTASTFYYALYPEAQRKNYMFSAIPWSEEKTEGFAGLHNASSAVVVIFDEASAIPDQLWEVAEGAMTDGEAFFFSFGNPTRNVGRFRECFNKHAKSMSFLRHVDSRSVRITNKVRLKSILDRYGVDHDVSRIRVLGQFPKGSLDGFFPYDLVVQAQHADLLPDPGAPLILAIDAARFGEDKMVCRFRQGKDARRFPVHRFNKLGTMEAADRVTELILRYDPDAVVIEGGDPGGGLVDALRRRHFRISEFHPGAKAFDSKRFINRRAELHSTCRDWMQDGGCIDEDDADLASDLTQIGFKFRESDSALQIESKKEMRARGLPSPDDGDSLVLTHAVKPPRRDARSSRRHGGGQGRLADGIDYDLFDG